MTASEQLPCFAVIAHRGSSGRAPENTLLAMRLALDEDGADGLELDLQRSRDGEVIVLHDETVDRTTDGCGLARDLELDRLRSLDARGGHAHAGANREELRIPTLREVLERFPNTWMSLDLKQGDPITERRTVQLLREFDATGRVVLSAESPSSARRLGRLAPECARFFDRRAVRNFYLRHRVGCWWGYRAPAASLQIPVRHGRHRLDAEALVDDAHRLGLRVLYWTVNDPREALRLRDLGADGVITDWPRRIREAL